MGSARTHAPPAQKARTASHGPAARDRRDLLYPQGTRPLAVAALGLPALQNSLPHFPPVDAGPHLASPQRPPAGFGPSAGGEEVAPHGRGPGQPERQVRRPWGATS